MVWSIRFPPYLVFHSCGPSSHFFNQKKEGKHYLPESTIYPSTSPSQILLPPKQLKKKHVPSKKKKTHPPSSILTCSWMIFCTAASILGQSTRTNSFSHSKDSLLRPGLEPKGNFWVPPLGPPTKKEKKGETYDFVDFWKTSCCFLNFVIAQGVLNFTLPSSV